MGRRSNRPTDVFMQIDMSGGPDACWEFQGRYNEKARSCYWKLDGKTVTPLSVVMELVGEKLEEGQLWRHKCDNRKCCNPKHVIAGTHQENMDDMKTRERHGLPHHTVRLIKKMITQTMRTDDEIAIVFGLSRRHINNIRNGNRYSHVEIENVDASGGTAETEGGVG